MIGGLNVPGEMIVVALVICADGTKIPVGLRLGDTENATVVKDLLADLVARGLRYEHGILAVIDGSKALRSAIVKVFGSHTLLPEHLILVVAGTTHAPPTMSAMDRRSDGGAKALATVRGRHIS